MTITLEIWMLSVPLAAAAGATFLAGRRLMDRDWDGWACIFFVASPCFGIAAFLPPVVQFESIPAAEQRKAEEPAVVSEGARDAKAGIPYEANPYPVPQGVGGDSWKHSAWQHGWREQKRNPK